MYSPTTDIMTNATIQLKCSLEYRPSSVCRSRATSSTTLLGMSHNNALAVTTTPRKTFRLGTITAAPPQHQVQTDSPQIKTSGDRPLTRRFCGHVIHKSDARPCSAATTPA